MKKFIILIALIFSLEVSAKATCVTDQEKEAKAQELREFALNGFPLNTVLADIGWYGLDLRTIDKDVLLMLLDNNCEAFWPGRGGYGSYAWYRGTVHIFSGKQQKKILERPDAEEIFLALIKSRTELYVSTVKYLLGYSDISSGDMLIPWDGDLNGLHEFPKKKLSFADNVISAYQSYVGTEMPKRRPCLITRNKKGEIIKRKVVIDGATVKSLATPKQIQLFYQLWPSRGENGVVWDFE